MLTAAGPEVTCLVHDVRRFALPDSLLASQHRLVRIEQDHLLWPESLADLPLDFDIAY